MQRIKILRECTSLTVLMLTFAKYLFTSMLLLVITLIHIHILIHIKPPADCSTSSLTLNTVVSNEIYGIVNFTDTLSIKLITCLDTIGCLLKSVYTILAVMLYDINSHNKWRNSLLSLEGRYSFSNCTREVAIAHAYFIYLVYLFIYFYLNYEKSFKAEFKSFVYLVIGHCSSLKICTHAY